MEGRKIQKWWNAYKEVKFYQDLHLARIKFMRYFAAQISKYFSTLTGDYKMSKYSTKFNITNSFCYITDHEAQLGSQSRRQTRLQDYEGATDSDFPSSRVNSFLLSSMNFKHKIHKNINYLAHLKVKAIFTDTDKLLY